MHVLDKMGRVTSPFVFRSRSQVTRGQTGHSGQWLMSASGEIFEAIKKTLWFVFVAKKQMKNTFISVTRINSFFLLSELEEVSKLLLSV